MPFGMSLARTRIVPSYKSSDVITCQPKTQYIKTELENPIAHFDEIIIEQRTESELVADNEDVGTEFLIMTSRREPIMYTIEDTDFCVRSMMCRFRPLEIQVFNGNGKEVIHISRSNNYCKCHFCCFEGWHEKITVELDGVVIGHIIHGRRWGKPKYTLVDEANVSTLTVTGHRVPNCRSCWRPKDLDFPVMRGCTQVGYIRKERLAFFPDPGYHRPLMKVNFPGDSVISERALILATAFVIEVHYYDEDPMTFLKN